MGVGVGVSVGVGVGAIVGVGVGVGVGFIPGSNKAALLRMETTTTAIKLMSVTTTNIIFTAYLGCLVMMRILLES